MDIGVRKYTIETILFELWFLLFTFYFISTEDGTLTAKILYNHVTIRDDTVDTCNILPFYGILLLFLLCFLDLFNIIFSVFRVGILLPK